MPNPFYIEPPNPLQALMAGQQGYDTSRKAAKENQLEGLRQQVANGAIPPEQAIRMLIAGGDTQSAAAYGGILNQQATRNLAERQFQNTQHTQSPEYIEQMARIQAKVAAENKDLDVTSKTDPLTQDTKFWGVNKRTGDIRELTPSGGAQPAVSPSTVAPMAQATSGIISAIPDSGPNAGKNIAPQINAAAPSVGSPGGRNEAYLNSLPEKVRSRIKGIADYEINPATMSREGGHREAMVDAAKNYDPTYDQTTYPMIQEARKKFAYGKQGDTIKSFNIAVDHLEQLGDLGKAMQNGDVPRINELKNWVKTNLGGADATNFNALKAIVGQEIVKAIVGMGGGVEERKTAGQTVAAASSPAQLAGVIETYKGAMAAQLAGNKRQYEDSTKRKDFDQKLSPKARAEMARHEGGHGATTPAGPAKPRLRFNPATGDFE